MNTYILKYLICGVSTRRERPALLGVLLFSMMILVLAGCVASSSEPPAGPATTESPTSARAIVVAESATPLPVESTGEPEATATAEPTATTEPTATLAGGVVSTPESMASLKPDPDVTRPPLSAIEQPAYAASDCSDKYPCNDDIEAWEARIQVPEGFDVKYFTRIDGNPNVITFGPDGLLYAATMTGEVYRIDQNGEIDLYVDGFLAPTGLAFQPGTDRLFITSRVEDLNEGGEAEIAVIEDGEITRLFGRLPCCYVSMHSANGIAFGPDGYGYVSVGGRADHGEILSGPNAGLQDVLQPLEASILRFSPDGWEIAPYARGFRNAYDIAWDADGQLYTTDNAPDFGPPEEFHKVVPGGQHGYPWYDCDACFSAPPDVTVEPPTHTFVPHASPTGITSYLADQFPGYFNSLFVTLWSAFPGAQKIVWFSPGAEETADFATGFAAPIDLTVGPDGSLFVVDWATGIIFQISYTGGVAE
jgi:glucose/arabinose dehydrogenase